MNNLLLVFLGGGLGSLARYGIGMILDTKIKNELPWATFSINVLACLILGGLTAWLISKPDQQGTRLLMGVGFCGGFSTFSTFTSETFTLIGNGALAAAILYILGSVMACLLAFALGIYLQQILR